MNREEKINYFSKFLATEGDNFEVLKSDYEAIREEVDRILPIQIHEKTSYKKARAKGLLAEKEYLRRSYSPLFNRNSQKAISLLDLEIERLENSKLVERIVTPSLSFTLIFFLILAVASIFFLLK